MNKKAIDVITYNIYNTNEVINMNNKKKSMTIRIEENEFKKIKIKLINDDKSFQEYVMELIRRDMKGE
jgi:predicted DNA binding CopG/RHH family protein